MEKNKNEWGDVFYDDWKRVNNKKKMNIDVINYVINIWIYDKKEYIRSDVKWSWINNVNNWRNCINGGDKELWKV
jgi:hypothetical protein